MLTMSLLQAILDVVVNLQFSLIEKLWQTFWRYSPSDLVEGTTITENRSALSLALSLSFSPSLLKVSSGDVLKGYSTPKLVKIK